MDEYKEKPDESADEQPEAELHNENDHPLEDDESFLSMKKAQNKVIRKLIKQIDEGSGIVDNK